MSITNTLTIFLYHGVTDNKNEIIRNKSNKHMFVQDFENQIKKIRSKYTLLSIDEVVEIHKSNLTWPRNAAAVTFDDGFKNNYKLAAPILLEYNIPTTFYVSSGMINTDMMFWVDMIEDCITRSEKNTISIGLYDTLDISLSNIKNKIKAINLIKGYCKQVSSSKKNKVINKLIKETKVTPSVEASDDYRLMNWNELKLINDESIFTVGGHTLYHDIMTANEIEKTSLDISSCLNLLNYNLEQRTQHFSYPEGQDCHYNASVISELKKHGVICCPTAVDGVNSKESLFELKRIMPGFMGRQFPNILS